jgi:hypothetical protein
VLTQLWTTGPWGWPSTRLVKYLKALTLIETVGWITKFSASVQIQISRSSKSSAICLAITWNQMISRIWKFLHENWKTFGECFNRKKEDNNNKQLVMKIRHFLAVRVNSQGVSKKTEQIWNCSQFRKTPICILFYIYIASLGTYNVE